MPASLVLKNSAFSSTTSATLNSSPLVLKASPVLDTAPVATSLTESNASNWVSYALTEIKDGLDTILEFSGAENLKTAQMCLTRPLAGVVSTLNLMVVFTHERQAGNDVWKSAYVATGETIVSTAVDFTALFTSTLGAIAHKYGALSAFGVGAAGNAAFAIGYNDIQPDIIHWFETGYDGLHDLVHDFEDKIAGTGLDAGPQIGADVDKGMDVSVANNPAITGFKYIAVPSAASNYQLLDYKYHIDGEKSAGNDIFTHSSSVTLDSTKHSIIDGGAGQDTVSYAGVTNFTSGIEISLHESTDTQGVSTPKGANYGTPIDVLDNIESAIATNFTDLIKGNGLANTLQGGDGADSIAGGAGSDSISGGAGNDLIYSYWNNDKFGSVYTAESASDSDTIHGDADNDTIIGGGGVNHLYGDDGNDLIIDRTNSGPGTIDGGANDDVIWGGNGDSVIGGAGNDTIYGTGSIFTNTASNGVATDGSDTFIAFGGKFGASSTGNYVNSFGVGETFTVNPTASLEINNGKIGNTDVIKIGNTVIQGTFDSWESDAWSVHLGFNPITHNRDVLVIYSQADAAASSYTVQVDNFHNGDFGITVIDDPNQHLAAPSSFATLTAPSFLDAFATPVTVTDPNSGGGGSTGTPITGTSASETISGTNLAENIQALAGDDSVQALAGDDTIEGGAGKDTMTGGTGADTFKFASATDSTETALDRVTDFSAADGDKIDLSGLGFTALVSGTTAAGELRLAYSATSDRTYVRSDQSTFEFYLDGDHRTDVTGSSFIWGTGSTNHAPTVATLIADQAATEGTAFAFTVPSGSFADSDGDTLAYTATKADGTALPTWLAFNASTRAFSGTAGASDSTLDVKVTVSDGHGGTVSDVFNLAVNHPSAPGSVINGTSGNDSLVGSAGADTIDGLAGIDTLTGGSGADVFRFSDVSHSLETALDRITDFHEAEGDKLDLHGLGFTALTSNGSTAAGELRLAYSASSDRTYVRSDQSTFEFYLNGDHRTTLTSSYFVFDTPVNTITGTTAADTLNGTSGNDFISGLGGNDSISAGDGDDTVEGGGGGDTMDGGIGNDTLTYLHSPLATGVSLVLGGAVNGGDAVGDVISNFENLIGSAYNDTLIGNSGNNYLDGSDGNDALTGGQSADTVGGDDTILGGLGNDTLNGYAGNDSLIGGQGTDSLNGGTGNDIVYGDDLSGTVGGNDTLVGSTGDDTLYGGTGNDSLNDGDGNDLLFGGDGNDTLNTQNGNNTISGGNGTDTFVISIMTQQPSSHTITDFTVAADGNGQYEKIDLTGLGASVSTLHVKQVGADTQIQNTTYTTLQGVTSSSLTLNHFVGVSLVANDLSGTANADTINGTAAHDSIDGSSGDDVLHGGLGNDTIIGGTGVDTMDGSSGADIFYFAYGSTGTGSSADHITDFSQTDADKINLHGFNLTAASFTGTGALTGGGTKSFGYDATLSDASGDYTLVKIDTNGDGVLDQAIRLDGAHLTLQSSDFTFV